MPEAPGPPPPRRRAIALRYDPATGGAPEVAASGAGLVAERILSVARDAGVPVREDPALTEALAGLALGAEVPPALWRAVAETLAWAYRLDLAAR